MPTTWDYESEWGLFQIAEDPKGWSVLFEGRLLEAGFATAEAALERLVAGGVNWKFDLVRLSSVYIPSKLNGWRLRDR
jgi:hypothetical protein